MKFSVFQLSRRGGRAKNEDRMGYCYTREASLFLLADGMGGHPEGEVAAQIAVQSMAEMFQAQAKPRLADVPAFLASALLAAHHQILRYADDQGMPDAPRTTLVAAVLQAGSAYWIHCGDSRLYLVRDGQVVARTQDHSYLAQHPARPLEVPHANRNVLFTCLGSPLKPVSDLGGPFALAQGDRILLCSDGLWGVLDDKTIAQQMERLPIDKTVPTLVDAALRKAGATSDNVTAIALEWETPDDSNTSLGISTDHIDEDGFASSFEAEWLNESDVAQLDEFDDAAIERSIAEINEAIRRSAARRR